MESQRKAERHFMLTLPINQVDLFSLVPPNDPLLKTLPLHQEGLFLPPSLPTTQLVCAYFGSLRVMATLVTFEHMESSQVCVGWGGGDLGGILPKS